MAHSNRNKQKEKRKAMKAARKASRRAEWAALAGTSKNKKKKLSRGGSGSSGIFAKVKALIMTKVNGVMVVAERMVHGGPDCGNVGCKRCSNVWKVA